MLLEERASQGLCFESRRDNTLLSAPRVSTGDWVKVGALGERFWCLVNTVHADGVLTASVANDLVLCPWKAGDEVTFCEGKILEVASLSDRCRFVQMFLVSGSRVTTTTLQQRAGPHPLRQKIQYILFIRPITRGRFALLDISCRDV